jgi:iron complex transport system substrate-binding protein
VKIGDGPATVIGTLCGKRRANRESGTNPELVEAKTLREKECGAQPRIFPRGFFVARMEDGLRSGRGWRRVITGVGLCALLFAVASRANAIGIARGQDAAANSVARVVTDEVGRRVAVPARVKRVVSLAPNLTETIYALGLEEELAGDTDYCDTPSAAKAKPHVGAPLNPSLEAIVGLRPDLVLATTSINRRETVDALERLGIAVYTSDPHTVRGMLKSIAVMAALLEPPDGDAAEGADETGAAFVAQLQARLDALHARLQDLPLVHVLFVVWEDPLISIGQNTFIADALRWAGAESVILSKQNWPQVTFEEVVRLEPEYIVLANSHAGAGQRSVAELRGRAGWKKLPAIESGHVAIISEEINRPSPGLIDAIEQLARELHPEAFDKKAENRNWKMKNGMTFDAFAVLREEHTRCVR